MKQIALFSMLMLSIPFSACRATTATPAATVAAKGPALAAAAASPKEVYMAANRFGFRLVDKLAQADPGKNLFVSPLSVAQALTMVFNGATGETEVAMRRALELSDFELGAINRASAKLTARLTKLDPKVSMDIANAVFLAQKIEPQKSFLATVRDQFQAHLARLDFDKPAAVDTVNAWVKEATHDKIDKIVDDLRGLVMLLANAVYFKGSWTHAFDPKRTREAPFQVSADKSVPVQLMSQSRKKFSYFEDNDLQAVNLPYGDKKFHMAVFLPKAGKTPAALLSRLAGEDWGQWTERFAPMEGTVWLPRFELEYEKKLNQALSALGMGIAFTGKARFDKIADELAISFVKHKSYVKVDEEGTEAAAVTVVGMRITSVQIVKRFHMKVDRPFLFVIHEQETGAVLFVGKIHNPKA